MNHGEIFHALFESVPQYRSTKDGGIVRNKKMHYNKRKAKRWTIETVINSKTDDEGMGSSETQIET